MSDTSTTTSPWAKTGVILTAVALLLTVLGGLGGYLLSHERRITSIEITQASQQKGLARADQTRDELVRVLLEHERSLTGIRVEMATVSAGVKALLASRGLHLPEHASAASGRRATLPPPNVPTDPNEDQE